MGRGEPAAQLLCGALTVAEQRRQRWSGIGAVALVIDHMAASRPTSGSPWARAVAAAAIAITASATARHTPDPPIILTSSSELHGVRDQARLGLFSAGSGAGALIISVAPIEARGAQKRLRHSSLHIGRKAFGSNGCAAATSTWNSPTPRPAPVEI